MNTQYYCPRNVKCSEYVNCLLLKEIGSIPTHNHDRLTGTILSLPLKQENWENIETVLSDTAEQTGNAKL